MTKVTITVGCPGSGKTTWAHGLDPVDNVVLSLDDFRIALFGSKDAYWNKVVPVHGAPIRNTVWKCYARSLWAFIHDGWPGHIVLCNTALDYATASRDFPILEKAGIVPTLRIFDVPLLELHERNRNRCVEEHLSAEYLEKCYQTMHRKDAWWKYTEFPTEYAE